MLRYIDKNCHHRPSPVAGGVMVCKAITGAAKLSFQKHSRMCADIAFQAYGR